MLSSRRGGRCVAAAVGLGGALFCVSLARAEEPGRPGYRLLRYDEDYTFVRERRSDADFWDPIKYVPLTKGGDGSFHASFGGSLRLRTEYHANPELGFVDQPVNDVHLVRGLVHADIHFGVHARLFTQLGTAWAFGRDLPERPVDEDHLSVQQGFAEFSVAPGAPLDVQFRLGRQEVSLGSSRLIGVRDGPNVRRSFDGLRVTLASSRVRVDLLGMLGVSIQRGVFDDRPDPEDALWGTYATASLVDERLKLDAYYLGIRRQATFQGDRDTELRHSLGSRVFGRLAWYDYNVEGIVQAGTFGARTIIAWTVASDQGATFRFNKGRLRTGLRANVTSGDRQRADSRLGTFNALFPNLAYFSQLTLISPANHYDIHPMASLTLFDAVDLELGTNWFWRQRTSDEIYTPPGVALVDGSMSSARFVGTQLSAAVTGHLGHHFVLTGYFSRFFAGPAITGVGGQSTDFFGLWSTYTF